MHSISKLHRGWEWKSSLTHYPTTTTNKYPLVRFRCINVKMTREFGWVGITRWQESYSTSPIPPSYLVVWLGLFVSPYLVAWFILFVITNATVILGRLVYLVCHQPSSPSYWLLGLSFKTTVPLTVKAKPTKNFSSKRKLPYHKICRSACLSPPPFFLFKACTFYPCVPYFIFLSPLLNPLFLTPLTEV